MWTLILLIPYEYETEYDHNFLYRNYCNLIAIYNLVHIIHSIDYLGWSWLVCEYHPQVRRQDHGDQSKRQGRGLRRFKRNLECDDLTGNDARGKLEKRKWSRNRTLSLPLLLRMNVIAPCARFYMTDLEWFNECGGGGRPPIFSSPPTCEVRNVLSSWNWRQVPRTRIVVHCANGMDRSSRTSQ